MSISTNRKRLARGVLRVGQPGSLEHEVPVIATPRRKRKATKPARPVTKVLLELAYYLNTSKVIVRPAKKRFRVRQRLLNRLSTNPMRE